jgi:hypothetical protein
MPVNIIISPADRDLTTVRSRYPLYFGMMMWFVEHGQERFRFRAEIHAEIRDYISRDASRQFLVGGIIADTSLKKALTRVLEDIAAYMPDWLQVNYAGRYPQYRFVLTPDVAHAHLAALAWHAPQADSLADARHLHGQRFCDPVPLPTLPGDAAPAPRTRATRAPSYMMLTLWLLHQGCTHYRCRADILEELTAFSRHPHFGGTHFGESTIVNNELYILRNVSNWFGSLLHIVGCSPGNSRQRTLLLYCLPLRIAQAHINVYQSVSI